MDHHLLLQLLRRVPATLEVVIGILNVIYGKEISLSLDLSYSSFFDAIAERFTICLHVFSILIEDH